MAAERSRGCAALWGVRFVYHSTRICIYIYIIYLFIYVYICIYICTYIYIYACSPRSSPARRAAPPPASLPRPSPAREVDVRLPGKGKSNSHRTRPVHLIITMIKWTRTSRLSIKNSPSHLPPALRVGPNQRFSMSGFLAGRGKFASARRETEG